MLLLLIVIAKPGFRGVRRRTGLHQEIAGCRADKFLR